MRVCRNRFSSLVGTAKSGKVSLARRWHLWTDIDRASTRHHHDRSKDERISATLLLSTHRCTMARDNHDGIQTLIILLLIILFYRPHSYGRTTDVFFPWGEWIDERYFDAKSHIDECLQVHPRNKWLLCLPRKSIEILEMIVCLGPQWIEWGRRRKSSRAWSDQLVNRNCLIRRPFLIDGDHYRQCNEPKRKCFSSCDREQLETACPPIVERTTNQL